jgi:hypothetical protein
LHYEISSHVGRLARSSEIRVDIDGPSYRDELARRRAKDHGIVDDST